VHQHQRALGHCYCHKCERAFTSVLGYEQHNSITHDIPCPTASCTERFSSASALAMHQRELGHCYCGLCNTVFGSKDDLLPHLLGSPIHQNQNTLYHCSSCSTAFKSKGALISHLASPIHSTKKPIQCPVCERLFNRHSAVIQHLENGICKQSKSNHMTVNAAPQVNLPKSGCHSQHHPSATAKSQKAHAHGVMTSSSPSPAPGSPATKKRSDIVLKKLAKARTQLELEAVANSSSGASKAPKTGTINSRSEAAVRVKPKVHAATTAQLNSQTTKLPTQAAPVISTSRSPIPKAKSSKSSKTIIEKPKTAPNLAATESGALTTNSVITATFTQASSSSDYNTLKESDPRPIVKIPIISLPLGNSHTDLNAHGTNITKAYSPPLALTPPQTLLPAMPPLLSPKPACTLAPLQSQIRSRKPKAVVKSMAVKGSVKWVARLPPKYEARLFVL